MDNLKNRNIVKIVEIVLIVSSFVNLIINSIVFSHLISNDNALFDANGISKLITINPLSITILLDNILVFIFGIWYSIISVKSSKDVLIKLSFSIFSIITTTIVSLLFINFLINIL